ncbi:MAG TPA: hypothetical protein VM056_07540 [Terriglobales bacterium]|nr:hypothetical protein [Terriglobales bacterium]
MQLNTRHRIVLVTLLLFTGSWLLAGAKLTEAAGLLMVGTAFAAIIGSDIVALKFTQTRQFLKNTQGLPRLVQLPLVLAFAGFVLSGIAINTNFQAFLSNFALAMIGLTFSEIANFDTKPNWLKITSWVLAIPGFFLGTSVYALIDQQANTQAYRIGQLGAGGLLFFLLGMFWFSKGWRSIKEALSSASTQNADESGKDTFKVLPYFGLLLSTSVLAVWLSLLAFSAFTNAIFPIETKLVAGASRTPEFAPIALLLFLTFSIHRSIRGMLSNNCRYLLRRRLALGSAGTLLLSGLFLAATFGIQNGYDRIETKRVEDLTVRLHRVGSEIGLIKTKELETTQEYIDEYAKLEPLIAEFDQGLNELDQFCAMAIQRNKDRGPINIQRFYQSNKEDNWNNILGLLQVMREYSALLKHQIATTREMSRVSPELQPVFWEENLQPLLRQEQPIVQRSVELQARIKR